jgi:hypothetical protein
VNAPADRSAAWPDEAAIGALSNQQGVMMRLEALDPDGRRNVAPEAEDMPAGLSGCRRDPLAGARQA